MQDRILYRRLQSQIPQKPNIEKWITYHYYKMALKPDYLIILVQNVSYAIQYIQKNNILTKVAYISYIM